MRETIFMETTRIAAERTVAEIQQELAEHGAMAVLLDYKAMQVEAVSFRLDVSGKEVPFMLPCRWRALETLLRGSGKKPRYDDTFEKWARRVAWRQILRWVQAQFALVETGMVKPQEVFLPYAQLGRDGKTVYERLEQTQFMQLEHKPKCV